MEQDNCNGARIDDSRLRYTPVDNDPAYYQRRRIEEFYANKPTLGNDTRMHRSSATFGPPSHEVCFNQSSREGRSPHPSNAMGSHPTNRERFEQFQHLNETSNKEGFSYYDPVQSRPFNNYH